MSILGGLLWEKSQVILTLRFPGGEVVSHVLSSHPRKHRPLEISEKGYHVLWTPLEITGRYFERDTYRPHVRFLKQILGQISRARIFFFAPERNLAATNRVLYQVFREDIVTAAPRGISFYHLPKNAVHALYLTGTQSFRLRDYYHATLFREPAPIAKVIHQLRIHVKRQPEQAMYESFMLLYFGALLHLFKGEKLALTRGHLREYHHPLKVHNVADKSYLKIFRHRHLWKRIWIPHDLTSDMLSTYQFEVVSAKDEKKLTLSDSKTSSRSSYKRE